MFDEQVATNLVNLYAVIYGAAGVVTAILGGYVADHIGISNFMVCVRRAAIVCCMDVCFNP